MEKNCNISLVEDPGVQMFKVFVVFFLVYQSILKSELLVVSLLLGLLEGLSSSSTFLRSAILILSLGILELTVDAVFLSA